MNRCVLMLLVLVVSSAQFARADDGHTCPDYSQHEAVLKHGQDCIERQKIEFRPTYPRRHGGSVHEMEALPPFHRLFNLRLELKALQHEELTPGSTTNEESWFACVEQGVVVSFLPRKQARDFCEPQTIKQDDTLTRLERSEKLVFFQKPKAGQYEALAYERLVGGLVDINDVLYAIDVNVLSDTAQASEKLNKICRKKNQHWKDCNYMYLAGMKAWFKDYDGALTVLDNLLRTPNKAPYDLNRLKNMAIAINGRKEDWNAVQSYEDDSAYCKHALQSGTILDVYANHRRKNDLIRFFRQCYDHEECCDLTLHTIIDCSAESDRRLVAYALRRRCSDDVSFCVALAKKRFFEESLATCLNKSFPIRSFDLANLLAILKDDYPTQFEQRLVLAAALCYEWGDKKLGGELLSNLSDDRTAEINNMTFVQVEKIVNDADRLLKYVSSITRAPEVLQKVNKHREVALQRKELLECLSLAERLEETGNTLFQQSKYSEARTVYSSALDIRRKNLKFSDCLLANTLQNLAQTSMMLNDVDGGCQQFDECISIYKQSRAREYLKGALESYGNFLNHFGKTKEAESMYAESKRYTD